MNFQKFLDKNVQECEEFENIKGKLKIKDGLKDRIFYLNLEEGYSIECEKPIQKIITIHLFSHAFSQFSPYKGNLPHSLTWQSTAEEIVSRFGEPLRKEGGNGVEIRLGYDSFGIECTFGSRIWGDPRVKLIAVALYRPEIVEEYCGICRSKPASLFCLCKNLRYCSNKCQEIFKQAHTKYCH